MSAPPVIAVEVGGWELDCEYEYSPGRQAACTSAMATRATLTSRPSSA